MGGAAQVWRDRLAEWAIPEHITAAVTESPWVLPTEVFARRADQQVARPSGPSWRRAMQALVPRGSALDVGAGAGAASLPLASATSELVAVDTSESMLAALAERAGRLGVPTRTVVGRWPDIADDVPVVDVVVCHHVWYNAPDLDRFAAALHHHARRRVVVELTATHPLSPLNPLWKVLHGLDRPSGPTAADAVAVLRELGVRPHEERWPRPPRPEYRSFDDMVAVTRRRLCLPPERAGELANLLVELGVDPAHPRDLGCGVGHHGDAAAAGSPADDQPCAGHGHRRADHPCGDELVTLWWDRGDGRG